MFIKATRDKCKLIMSHPDFKEHQELSKIMKIICTEYHTDERRYKQYKSLFKDPKLSFYIQTLCTRTVNLEIFE